MLKLDQDLDFEIDAQQRDPKEIVHPYYCDFKCAFTITNHQIETKSKSFKTTVYLLP